MSLNEFVRSLEAWGANKFLIIRSSRIFILYNMKMPGVRVQRDTAVLQIALPRDIINPTGKATDKIQRKHVAIATLSLHSNLDGACSSHITQ